jgi:hypothetical protein
MKVELTTREIRLLASALQNEAVRLAHHEREPSLNKEYETLWNKFIYWEANAKRGTNEKHEPETNP